MIALHRTLTLAATAATAAALAVGTSAAEAETTLSAGTTWHTESYGGAPNLYWVNGGTLDLTAARTKDAEADVSLTVGADVSLLQDRSPSSQPVVEQVYACTSQGCRLESSRSVTVRYPGNVTRYRYEDTWAGRIKAGATLTGVRVDLLDGRDGSLLATVSGPLD